MAFTRRNARLLPLLIPLLLFLVFFSLTTNNARRAPWYEEALWNVITPPQKLASAIGRGVGGAWNHYFYLVGASKENKILKRRVAELEGKFIDMKETEGENARLRDLLGYRDLFPQNMLVARVVSSDPRAEFKSITIDRGSSDGIRPLMSVVGPKGLVGKVGKVTRGAARVLLITDPNSAVDVMIQRSRARGLVVGTAKRTALRPGYYLSRLEYLRRISDVRDDDVVVTSGLDRIFPPGIPVGTVCDLSKSRYGVFLEANVVPFENMAELQEVLVLLDQVDTADVRAVEE